MAVLGQQLGEQAMGVGRGGGGNLGRGGLAQFGQDSASVRNIGGLREGTGIIAKQMRRPAGGQGRRQVGGVGFQEVMAVGDAAGVFAGAVVLGPSQGATKRNVDIARGEVAQDVGGAGISVDEEAGGVAWGIEENGQHRAPGITAMDGGGHAEFIGEVELGKEDGFAVAIEAVGEFAIQPDFANAGGGGGEDFAQVVEPTRGAVGDVPRVQAVRGNDAARMGRGQGADGGPVGFAGGGDVQKGNIALRGATEHAHQVRRKARVLQVAVGITPNQFFSVARHKAWYFPRDMVRGRFIPVNLQIWRRVGLGLLLILGSAGCSTFSHYPTGMETTTLAPLRAGKTPDYKKNFGPRLQGNTGVLFAMEMGRVAQVTGDADASREAFAKASALTREQDEKAVISASGAAAQGGAVLVNDKAIPYRAPSYERTLVHHYQALNYLTTNDLTGAGVEVRLANREQEDARRKREAEINRAKSKRKNPEAAPEATAEGEERDPHLDKVYAGLDQVAGEVKSSFQNAATFYLSGVIWEMLGEQNDAYIDYKRALEIYPENPYLQADVVRLGKRLGMREDVDDFARRFPAAADTPAAGTTAWADKARLVVLLDQGLVIPKEEISVAYPLGRTLSAIALPAYTIAPPAPVPLVVKVGGKRAGTTAPICNISALAARALGEQMPGILTRQIARVVAKTAAAEVASQQGGEIVGLLAAIYNVASEQADLRSWLTLPAHIQIASVWVPPGEKEVALAAPGDGTTWSGVVTLTAGKTTILYVTQLDYAVFSRIMMQP